MATTEPIRDKNQLRELMSYFKNTDRRNHVLVNMGINTALRISDILSLKTDDVYDYKGRRVRKTIHLKEQKTGKSKTIAVNNQLAKALDLYFPLTSPGQALISNSRTGKALTRTQAYRIIRDAGADLGIGHISCHSLRKTFGYHSWKSGTPTAVIMEIYNHSNFEVTRRYLGVAQDDKDEAYMNFCDFCA